MQVHLQTGHNVKLKSAMQHGVADKMTKAQSPSTLFAQQRPASSLINGTERYRNDAGHC